MGMSKEFWGGTLAQTNYRPKCDPVNHGEHWAHHHFQGPKFQIGPVYLSISPKRTRYSPLPLCRVQFIFRLHPSPVLVVPFLFWCLYILSTILLPIPSLRKIIGKSPSLKHWTDISSKEEVLVRRQIQSQQNPSVGIEVLNHQQEAEEIYHENGSRMIHFCLCKIMLLVIHSYKNL